MPPAERHSARFGHTAHGNDAPVCTWPRGTAGAGVFARCQWGDWVLRPCPCAYLRYSGTTKAGSLPSSSLLGQRCRYYEPLGLPPSTIPFRLRLIGTAFARRGPPGRVSPVPYQAVLTCPPPYPVGVLHPSGSRGCSLLPSSWHERLGQPIPFRVLMSRGCKVHLSIGPANLLPSQ